MHTGERNTTWAYSRLDNYSRQSTEVAAIRSAVDERVMAKSVRNIFSFYAVGKTFAFLPHLTRNDLDTLLHSGKPPGTQVSPSTQVARRVLSTQGARTIAGDAAVFR